MRCDACPDGAAQAASAVTAAARHAPSAGERGAVCASELSVSNRLFSSVDLIRSFGVDHSPCAVAAEQGQVSNPLEMSLFCTEGAT